MTHQLSGTKLQPSALGYLLDGVEINDLSEAVFYMDPNLLNIFVAVVFVNSPIVFRIVRGLTMDIKTWDYVAQRKPVARARGL